MFALLLLLLPSLCQSLPHSQELKNCDSSGPRVSALSLNSALSTFLCYTEKELAAMEEEQKKRKLALKIVPSIRHAESGGFEKLVEVLTDMKEEDLVKIVNVVINNDSNEGERKTLPEYIQVIEQLIGETGVESELAKNLHLVSLLKSDLEDQGRGGRGAFGNFVLSILGMPPLFPDGKDDSPTTVAPGSTTMTAASSTGGSTAASTTGGSTAVTTTASSSTGGSTAASSTGGSTASSATGGSTATSATGGSTAATTTAASTTGGSTAASTTVGSTAASTTGASTAASTTGASTAASTTGASTAAATTGASTASSTAAASTTAVSTAASTTAASTTGASTAASTTVASTTVASTATSTAASTTGVTTASTTVASTAASTTGASTAASTTVSTTAASTVASTTVASTVATTTAAPPTCPGNSDQVSAVDCDCGGNICTGGTQGCETAVSLCRDVCSTVDAPITGNDPCFCKLQGSTAADLCAVGQTCSSTTGLCSGP